MSEKREWKKTKGKCKCGFASIEVQNGKCMDALNMSEYRNDKDCWSKDCKTCSLLGRKPTDVSDIIDALREKGVLGEE